MAGRAVMRSAGSLGLGLQTALHALSLSPQSFEMCEEYDGSQTICPRHVQRLVDLMVDWLVDSSVHWKVD